MSGSRPQTNRSNCSYEDLGCLSGLEHTNGPPNRCYLPGPHRKRQEFTSQRILVHHLCWDCFLASSMGHIETIPFGTSGASYRESHFSGLGTNAVTVGWDNCSVDTSPSNP